MGLKSFSADQPSGKAGRAADSWIVAMFSILMQVPVDLREEIRKSTVIQKFFELARALVPMLQGFAANCSEVPSQASIECSTVRA